MASYNKITLVGNVGNDPQIKIVGDNRKVVDISIAVNERARGNQPEKTEWYRVSFWDAKADIVANYVRKGSQLFVEGRLSVSTYTDPNTNRERYRLDVLGTELVLLGNRPEGESGPARTFEPREANSTVPTSGQGASQPMSVPPALAKTQEEDDLPF